MTFRDIATPSDLRKLPKDQLQPLADQLRDYIIDTLASHPGHLASSLGTVELTVALHYVFNTPDDKLVWDVGHQAYTHKIITGRGEQFASIRTYGGLSGFPRRDESEYDPFGTGHSSTSISAALGMATASLLQGDTARTHIAVIGDGALTGGEAFEALNNAGESNANLLIILNDNGISIDKAVGGLDKYLTRLTASRHYNRLKEQVWQRLDGTTGHRRHDRSIGLFQRMTSLAKTVALGSSNLFEALGIRYFGPIDGHNMGQLLDMLGRMKGLEGPRILHVITTKGKGLRQAENDPVAYHAPGQYDIRTGNQLQHTEADTPLKYQEVFGHTMVELASQNPRIVGISPAMLSGSSLTIMQQAMPDRVFDVGIAEQHAATFAAGLAASGMVPFCNIYSSFAQRAFDQIIHDVALQKLHVVFCLDRAGLVGDDGPTHHGVFDLAALRPIPNLTICAPADEHELRNMMYTAQLDHSGPFVIRYPRGKSVHSGWKSDFNEIKIGEGCTLRQGTDVAILALGHPCNDAIAASDMLLQKGISAAVFNMRFLKPLDTMLLDQVASGNYNRIITVEDGIKAGGFGEAVMEYMAEQHPNTVGKIKILAIGDCFVPHGSVAQLKADCRIDADAIMSAAIN